MKIILFSFLFISAVGFSQKKKQPVSIISSKVAIRKYHNKEELDRMQKGELLILYIERIKSLTKTLPYIAFARMPGVTMASLGIPENNDNTKALENEFEASDTYLESTIKFQKRMLPYCDKSNLIAAVLFYEETMKSLHEYSEFQ